MSPNDRPWLWLARSLLIAQVALAFLIVRNWAYVTTYRLYLDRRVGDARQSAAGERFDIEGARVVPQIVTHDRDRIGFAVPDDRPSTLHVEVRPSRPAHYEIRRTDGSGNRVIARGDVATAAAVTAALPAGSTVVELVSDAAVTWVDPRIVRDLRIERHAVALSVLLAIALLVARVRSPPAPTVRARVVRFKLAASSASVVLTLTMLEGGLRVLGDRVPAAIAAERHDLGEVRRDPRWQDSARYGRRLREHVNAINEWRYGDIVRMGFVPTSVADGTLHRFHFRTDGEGFRNAVVRDPIRVAALGDSFTDAMTLPAEAAWPTLLERRLGAPVQNYGTAGFGPQQERLVLEDFVAPHRPRVVVLAFFAGNDIFDAEAFEEFERSGGATSRPAPGWRIKDVYSRADTWYVVSALNAGARWLSRHEPTSAAAEAVGPPDTRAGGDPPSSAFDRGMFAVPVHDRVLRWALMPPYLNTLRFSERDFSQRRGWAVTRAAITAMQERTQAFGGTFVVMFLPFKSQVYLPLLRRSFSREDLASAFDFYLGNDESRPDIDAMFANRLAQNHLMRRFCEVSGIPFLDTTGALQQRVESGENAYFPDESHLNETGHAIVADALAAFLDSLGISEF